MTITEEKIIVIVTDETRPTDERISELLKMGTEVLGLSMGIVSNIIGRKYTVMHTTNPDLAGQEFNTGNTYCSITLSLQNERVLPVDHFAVSEHFRHPAYAAFKLETYIGTPLNVNGKRYGTLNFTNAEERGRAFNREEQDLVLRLAEAIGKILEQN